ncbi:unnamed protein product [Amoebophrya sp. A120]|nr:unnamed protein product [Amoebophrya sp. A120]|eukprot:GSA120T00008490001.1
MRRLVAFIFAFLFAGAVDAVQLVRLTGSGSDHAIRTEDHADNKLAAATPSTSDSTTRKKKTIVPSTALDSNDQAKSFYHFDFQQQKWVETAFPGAESSTSTTLSAEVEDDPSAAQVVHGQAGQDWLVQSLLNCKSMGVSGANGFFIELGSHDASIISNSLLLEKKFNWQGLCLEADPQYLSGYKQRKNCKLVQNIIGYPTGREVEFAFHPPETNGLSGIIGNNFDNTKQNLQYGTSAQKTRVISLEDVWRHFNAPSTIDYFSLDVEGAESLVMENFPWDKLRFRVLTVERAKPDLQLLLQKHGYKKVRSNASFEDTTWVDTKEFSDLTISKFANGKPIDDTCMVSAGFPRPSTLVGRVKDDRLVLLWVKSCRYLFGHG